jgi:hypothetical protein
MSSDTKLFGTSSRLQRMFPTCPCADNRPEVNCYKREVFSRVLGSISVEDRARTEGTLARYLAWERVLVFNRWTEPESSCLLCALNLLVCQEAIMAASPD